MGSYTQKELLQIKNYTKLFTMKTNHFLSLVSLMAFRVIFAQNAEPCNFDKYQRINKRAINTSELQIRKGIRTTQEKLLTHNPNLKTIPVVVHVIHMGGTENISDAQVQSQIDVLNEDFRKKAGTNGDGTGVDTEMEFCLAKKDPQGRCTNGIVRVNSPLSNHQTYQRSQLSQLSFWDNNRYLNMYVVKNINSGSGILGYSSFPGGPSNEDGIVIRHDYFGKIGTAAASLGRTTTHEIGHWFGLYHTFNGGCGVDTCADGDYVCDTPPVANPNFGCPTGVNSCTNDNFPDQIKNYLDYSDDNCKNMFTAGQKIRAQATLAAIRDTIWLAWNIDSTGCDSGHISTNCKVIADFVTLTPNICVGNSITFYEKSQNNPITYQWSFQGGTSATSTVANPTVSYTAVGTYSVKLIVTNIYGTDSLTFTNYINVTTPPIGQVLPYFEGFENYLFPPNGITIDNPDAGITWERDTTAVAFQASASAKINNLININYGQSDAMILPGFDFTTFTGVPYLYFKWAYARSDPNYSDELIVLVSKDCGVNWTQVFYKTGAAMTTGATQTTAYIPNSATVWKTANINLGAYSTYQNVLIKIVNVTDGGNNLYVDNINLGANTVGVEENDIAADISVYPNPANQRITLHSKNAEFKNPVSVYIYNYQGKEIEKFNQIILQNHQMDISALPDGIYLFKISIGKNEIVRKIVVIH
jgi:PKD repeat protein